MSKTNLSFIYLKGCRAHNLKNLNVKIPKNSITVITGVSGSGKSSLGFDTLFAEGQRRYLEYLSPKVRSWIKQMPKPQVDFVEGLSPTLAIGQGSHGLFPTGIVATYTDLHEFFALLFSVVGEQHSPTTGKKLIRYSRQEIIDLIIKENPQGARIQILAPMKTTTEHPPQQALTHMQQLGFVRFKIDGADWNSDDPLPSLSPSSSIDVVVDRLEMKEGLRERIALSVETAMDLSQGILKIQEGKDGSIRAFTEIYVCPDTGFSFVPLKSGDFNFLSSQGACKFCFGHGGEDRVNPDLVLSVDGPPVLEQVFNLCEHLPSRIAESLKPLFSELWKTWNLDSSLTLKKLSKDILEKILFGSEDQLVISLVINEKKRSIQTGWRGLIPFLNEALKDKFLKQSFWQLGIVEWMTCPACNGARLKPESLACLIEGRGIHELYAMTISELEQVVKKWHFNGKKEVIANEILPHIYSRLRFLAQVGLGYLSLNRKGKTLSDGEAQRIQLASQIGAKLSGIIYVLDEPSLGLHRQDIHHLHMVIKELKELGNTVVIVEHEKSLIGLADHIIEMGPGAGKHGGDIVFQGDWDSLMNSNSLTGQWLSGRLTLSQPPRRKSQTAWLHVKEAKLHNLKSVNVKIPLHSFVGICGVSGSGKSTLALDIIADPLKSALLRRSQPSGLSGFEGIKRVIVGERLSDRVSPRSIPATYVGVMTPIRSLFAETRLAKARGYGPARFSLNKRGGRCEACEGLGRVRVTMQFMPDLFIPCELCQGKRYNSETLQVTWNQHHMADILEMSVEQAALFFKNIPSIAKTLNLMSQMGLEYLTLGQPFNTLSAGEIQRLRLVSDLSERSLEPTLYILDEPSSGLHLHDIEKLVRILHQLVEKGHSVICIEHHLDILNQADWVIELGPEGGPKGGYLLFEGPPEKLALSETPTGKVFKSNVKVKASKGKKTIK